MVFWLKQKFFLLMGVTLSLLIFFSYQNCTRVRFEAEKVDAASKAGVKDAHFECTPNQTQVCDIAGIVGTMSCETTDHGPAWGSCIIPPTTTTTTMPAVTTTTLPGATTTTTVTTTSTTTTTIRANNPCLLILNDVANPVALANGAAYTAYLEPLVPASGACQSQSRICMNGSVTGSYQYSSCVKDSGQCQLNGVTVNHNSSAVFFEANVVPFGQHCKSETRNCRDRILDGSYQFPGPCTVAPPANCDFGNNTVLHGNSVDVYPSATVPYGQSCVSQKRNCFNGNLDGHRAPSLMNKHPLNFHVRLYYCQNHSSLAEQQYMDQGIDSFHLKYDLGNFLFRFYNADRMAQHWLRKTQPKNCD
jgi:hypothetical protein